MYRFYGTQEVMQEYKNYVKNSYNGNVDKGKSMGKGQGMGMGVGGVWYFMFFNLFMIKLGV